MADWKVNKSQRVCSASGRVFTQGDSFFSALKSEKEQFVRYDYAPEEWEKVARGEFFSFWKTQLPDREGQKKNKLKIDVEAFYTFFINLYNNSNNEANNVFKYLLALILIRKRLLRLDEIEKCPEKEYLHLFDTREKKELTVEVPEVTADAIKQAKEELEQIFECSTDE